MLPIFLKALPSVFHQSHCVENSKGLVEIKYDVGKGQHFLHHASYSTCRSIWNYSIAQYLSGGEDFEKYILRKSWRILDNFQFFHVRFWNFEQISRKNQRLSSVQSLFFFLLFRSSRRRTEKDMGKFPVASVLYVESKHRWKNRKLFGSLYVAV